MQSYKKSPPLRLKLETKKSRGKSEMETTVKFTLSFNGGSAKNHLIDLYDVSQALIGFQRSLALTSHLVINNEIITQAPSLKGAQILSLPPKEGSWEIIGLVVVGVGAVGYKLGTAPKNTPLGHLIFSLYDYVVKESLGIHVDYEKSLGQLYEESKEAESELHKIEQHSVDSLIEKCSTAITEIHRPIYKTQSAYKATIIGNYGNGQKLVGGIFDSDTYEYIREEFEAEVPVVIKGRVSSYNNNTYKGRIYVAQEGRPVSFELSENCRKNSLLQIIVASLSVNAIKDFNNEWSQVYCQVLRITSRSGHLKSYRIINISHSAIKNLQ